MSMLIHCSDLKSSAEAKWNEVLQEGPLIGLRDPLGCSRSPVGSCILLIHASQLCLGLDACRQSGDPEAVTQDRNGTDDCGLRHRHAVSHFLVVMDVLGPETL